VFIPHISKVRFRSFTKCMTCHVSQILIRLRYFIFPHKRIL
jgi:hypothetical protein